MASFMDASSRLTGSVAVVAFFFIVAKQRAMTLIPFQLYNLPKEQDFSTSYALSQMI